MSLPIAHRSMRLYAIPFGCSLAPHVALREAGLAHEITWVTRTTLRLENGGDLRDVNPKGKVATLVHEDGTSITENTAVLLAIAELAPDAKLAPTSGLARLRLQEWLSFVATELHKRVLASFFDPAVPQAMKDHVTRNVLPELLHHPAEALRAQRFLLGDDFTVADAYLFWSLLLIPRLGVDLEAHPSLVAFRERVLERPPVREALRVEKRAFAAAAGPP